MEKQTSHIT